MRTDGDRPESLVDEEARLAPDDDPFVRAVVVHPQRHGRDQRTVGCTTSPNPARPYLDFYASDRFSRERWLAGRFYAGLSVNQEIVPS